MGGARIMSVSCVSFLHSCYWMGVTWITKHHSYVVWPCREKEKHWTRYLSPAQAWTSHPKEGCHYGYLYHRHCPGGATYPVVAHKKRTMVQEWLQEEESTYNTEYLMVLWRIISQSMFSGENVRPQFRISDNLWMSSFPIPWNSCHL